MVLYRGSARPARDAGRIGALRHRGLEGRVDPRHRGMTSSRPCAPAANPASPRRGAYVVEPGRARLPVRRRRRRPIDGRPLGRAPPRAELTSIALALGAALGWGTRRLPRGPHEPRDLGPGRPLDLAVDRPRVALVAALFVGLDDPARSRPALRRRRRRGAWRSASAPSTGRWRSGAMAIAAPIAATSVVIPVACRPRLRRRAQRRCRRPGSSRRSAASSSAPRDPESAGKRDAALAAGVGLALARPLGGGLTSTALAEAGSAGVLWVFLVQRATVGAPRARRRPGPARAPGPLAQRVARGDRGGRPGPARDRPVHLGHHQRRAQPRRRRRRPLPRCHRVLAFLVPAERSPDTSRSAPPRRSPAVAAIAAG